ncbi:DUF1398 domain-containing protein [Oharaeibacter diazotrophicus]|uniref:Phage envelope protein n=1 Tax=Oharaeibacter diazotrophicus TaxID=1920512 RepID=A0A4R6RJD4_9HYPH|nr:DUF1398 domain-containing protein [Oharaeibacter diazotrophicus]TDP86731.1 hypothetical protein EDD54_0612 [Oharaeibacter diazotrophicus]BBE71326.1 hypothetical protein OHA_1_00899 [Pleomorphomonas sp. SM30]GLS78082.1 hypothetical protein GCM10007904_34190 [Oharaeibacter diazotrophicus]
MDERRQTTARTCLEAAEHGTMAFPEIVATLAAAGFESYAVDFRRATATYYLPDGDSIALPSLRVEEPVAAMFDTARVRAAIREAQQNAPGYTYAGFCRKVVAAGCAGYVVSFTGRRALYVGRTAETHVEHFPR